MAKLSLNDIVNIVVNLSPRSAIRKGFNLGLFIGSSPVIDPNDRVKIYNSLDAMYEDGFKPEMPEYKAASKYFQQTKKPTRVAIGRHVKSEVETALDAVRACRNKNTDWYLMSFCGATKDEILQISEYIETAVPSSTYAYTTNEQDVFKGEADSVFGMLKSLSRRRTFGQYSETEDAVAAIIGYAMGANVKTARSAYTLMHKTETGVKPDSLDDTQVNALQRVNGNYYVSRGYDDEYSMFETGVMADGCYFDEILNLDMLVNDMQLAVVDLFKSRSKVPQTEAGMNDIKLALKPSLETMRSIGFIAPGKWEGAPIWLTADYCALDTGEMLTDGYLILSEPVDNQSQANRDARIAPPIYTPIKCAGAIHTVLVQIDVNR